MRVLQLYCAAAGLLCLPLAVADLLPAPGATSVGSRPYVVANSLSQPRETITEDASSWLPTPVPTSRQPIHLSMRDAILLALRNNPDVESSELQRVLDKYAVIVAHYAYLPQFTITGTGNYSTGTRPSYALGPAVSLQTPIGTIVTASYGNPFSGAPGTVSLNITQPLLKGGGWAFNSASLAQADDQEKMNRLTFKSSVITVVVTVINAYRSLVQDYNSLDIQRRAVLRAEQTVQQTTLQVKAGKVSPSDLLQQKANLAQQKLATVQQQSSVDNNYQQFLQALGLVSTVKIIIDKQITLGKFVVPDLQKSIQLALENNIEYQTALISLRGTKRALLQAENAALWTLNMGASTSAGQSTGTATIPASSTGTAGATSIAGGGPSVSFNLTIPIDDKSAKSAILSARIGLENAQIKLQESKEQLVRNVTNQITQLHNQYAQLTVAMEALKLQAQTVADAQIKLKYGQTTVFEVNQLQDQMLSQETSLVGDKIQLLNAITTFNQTLGTTLEKWNITLRY